MNRLILGDNLEIMKTLESESVDLIYLDPPFFSNRDYEVIWGDEGEIRSFEDRWAGGIDHYIAWLKERVEQMHRLLKKTGSLFLHCDWHADAYIRVDILDTIFGIKNFRNEIVWKRNSAHNSADRCGNIHDSIFYYQKSSAHQWNVIYQNYSEQYLEEFFDSVDENGRKYKRADLTGAGTTRGISGKPWRNIDVKAKGRHWAYVPDELERLDKMGKIHWPQKKGGMPRLKVYPEDMKGLPLQDVWDDIRVLHNLSKERIGYPTQKPEALLERIIKIASKEESVVLDPFMGGGTTVAVAERLGRRFIGIDQSTIAVKVAELRLQKQMDMFSELCTVHFHRFNYNKLRYEDAFEFQDWIVQQFGGVPNTKKRGDGGMDGKKEGIPIQVKRSDNVGRNVIDNFLSAIKRDDKKLYDKNVKEKKPVGSMIAFSCGSGARQEVARLKVKENIIIELVEVNKIVAVAEGPAEITVKIRELSRDMRGNAEIEFAAKAKSEAAINFYAWDFDFDEKKGFKATKVIDSEGKQTHHFKAGEYVIAVKAVDNDGLESIEVFKIKVNGVVKKLQ